jgi:predicted O-methyltransferase YrrM
MLKEKLESAAWFLKRPKLYKQLLKLSFDRIFPHALENSSKEAELWCQKRAINTQEAIKKITGSPAEKDWKELFPNEFQRATENAKKCPIPMGGPGDLNLLFWLTKRTNAKKILETGVAYGWSSLALLIANEEAELVSTDMPYPKLNNDDWVGCVVPENLRKRWTLIRNADLEAIPQALKKLQTLDLCHYDSDKSYRGRLWALPKLWEHLKPGGILISDDISDNLGFADFCKKIGRDPIVVFIKNEMHTKYVGILIKN